jgi:hypothetical protein
LNTYIKGDLHPLSSIRLPIHTHLHNQKAACLPFHTLVHSKVIQGKQELF